jgi:hypothetical protein
LSEKKIKLDEMMPLIRETLNGGHEVTFLPRGTSMLPTLVEGRDSVTLASPPPRLKKYDIALYQRSGGQYVLHRVVGVGEDYTFMGDNQFFLERGIKHSQIIAVCDSITRKGKRIFAHSPLWRMYAVLWYYSRFPRRVFRGVKSRLKRLFNK